MNIKKSRKPKEYLTNGCLTTNQLACCSTLDVNQEMSLEIPNTVYMEKNPYEAVSE